MTGPGLPGWNGFGNDPDEDSGAVYGYENYSDLVALTLLTRDGSTIDGSAIRMFEENRDGVTQVENEWTVGSTTTTVSKYEYLSDGLGRREHVVTTGAAFSPSRFTLFGYNDRSELTGSGRFNGTNPGDTGSPVTTQQFGFGYDLTLDNDERRQGQVGNRTEYTGDDIEGVKQYLSNEIGRASCREECERLCRSRWSPYH